jgi:hypothetical protein
MVKVPPGPWCVALVALALAACRREAQPPPAPSAPAQPAAKLDASALADDYDPTVLVDKGGDPLGIYLKEPRHPTWAGVVEEAIGGQLRRDLKSMVPETRGLSMGCKTLSCLILLDVPKEKMEAARAVVMLVTLGPITVDLGVSAEGRAQILVLTERRMADPAVFTSWYRRARRNTLEGIRSGKEPNPLPVPPSEIPKE